MTVALFLRDAGPITPEYVSMKLQLRTPSGEITTGFQPRCLTMRNAAEFTVGETTHAVSYGGNDFQLTWGKPKFWLDIVHIR